MIGQIIIGTLWLLIGFVEFLDKSHLNTTTSSSATHYQLLALLFVAVIIAYSMAIKKSSVQKFLLSNSALQFLTYTSRKEGLYIVYRTSYFRPLIIILLVVVSSHLIPVPLDILFKYIVVLPILVRMFFMVTTAWNATSTHVIKPSWHEVEWRYKVSTT